MNSSLILIKSNFKKTKAQTVAIFILISLTAMLINLCLMDALDYQNGYDIIHRELNESDATFMITGLDSEIENFENEFLDNNSEIDSYQISPVAILKGSVPYGENNNYKTFFYAIKKTEADSKTVSKYRYEQITEGSGAFLPYQFYISGNYNVGDRFVLNDNGENVVDTVVRGFYSCTMTSNMNARICGFILTDDIYETVAPILDLPFGRIGYDMLSVKLNSGVDCSKFEYDTISRISEDYTNIKLLESNNTALVKSTEYSTQIIAVSVLLVAGILFALVSIVLISSNTVFFINTNMKSFGMLKAVGYKSGKLRMAIIAEFAIVTLLATLCGTALAYAVFPSLNTLMESITAIKYPVHFMIKPVMITVISIMILVLITVWIATDKIKKLPPISAIRNENIGKLQLRNIIPVEKSKLPVNFNLALKTMCLNWKQNIIIFIALLGISLGSVFCILMYQNVVQTQKPVIELTNQNAHSFVSIDSENDSQLKQILDSDERVENYYLYSHRSKVQIGDVALISTVIDDCTKIKNKVLVYSGVMPKKDNEVAVGVLFAENNNLNIGDTVTVSLSKKSEKYKITAFIQIVGNEGKDIVFVKDGYKKLADMDSYDYLITLNDSNSIQSFNNDLKQIFTDAYIENYQKYTEGTTASFISLMRFMIIGIIIICIFLMSFVLYILVKTLLFKKQKEYSIMKSIGYSSNTLIIQTAMSFLPVVTLSLIISLPLASLTINDIFSFFIHDLGAFRTVFDVSPLLVAVAGVIMVILSFIFVCVFSIKIRNYSPKQLLNGN